MPAPAYEDRQVWLPNVSALQPGDILLTRSIYGEKAGGDWTARLIRFFSIGRYEHAALCTSPPTLAEAAFMAQDQGGVFTLSLARCFVHDLRNVRVLRWPDEATAHSAAAWCQRQVGRSYSRMKALGVVFPVAQNPDDRGVFCSSLVAHAYKTADPVGFARLRPDRVSPSGLCRLKGFVDVTQTLFRQGLAPRNAEELHALDGHGQWSPSINQTTVTYAYAQTLLPLSDYLVSSFPEAKLTAPGTFFEVIEFLPKAYLAITKIPAARQEAYVDSLYAIDAKGVALLQDGRLTAVLEEMCSHDQAAMDRLVAESFKPIPDIDLEQEAQVLAARRSSLAARRASIAFFDRYAAELSSVRLWNAFVEATATALEAQMSVQEAVLLRCGKAHAV